MEIIKYPKRQDCHYKLTAGSSNETSINLSYDILCLLFPQGIMKGETRSITFKVYRDDFIKALCYITQHLPYYTTRSSNSYLVEYSYDSFAHELYTINSFFNGPVADYTVTIYYRNDGRIYLKDLSVGGFNIRRFLVEDRATLRFLIDDKPTIRLKLSDNPNKDNENAKSEELEPVYNIPKPTKVVKSLAVRDKILKDFIFKVVLLINKSEGFSSFEKYVFENSQNIQLKKDGAFRLTGMFISTSYADIMKRNRLGLKPRWFDSPFVLKGKTVYLSTQWYGNGQYSLMFDDFKNLITTCFGSRYYFDQNENGEFELWKVTSEETEEILESSLNKVIYDFQHLNTAKRDGKLAPHKAIMILSIMDLISKGKITSPSIMYSEELESTFEEIWEEYVPQDCTFQCIASTPFWHMKGEPFWSISQLNGDTLNSVSGTPSASALQQLQVVGTLSKTTFKLMAIENYRTKLKEALIEKYL